MLWRVVMVLLVVVAAASWVTFVWLWTLPRTDSSHRMVLYYYNPRSGPCRLNRETESQMRLTCGSTAQLMSADIRRPWPQTLGKPRPLSRCDGCAFLSVDRSRDGARSRGPWRRGGGTAPAR